MLNLKRILLDEKCPNCGTIVSDDCHYCVRCGCPLPHQKSVTPTGQQKNTDVEYLEDDENKVVKYSIIAGVVVVLLAVLGFYFLKVMVNYLVTLI